MYSIIVNTERRKRADERICDTREQSNQERGVGVGPPPRRKNFVILALSLHILRYSFMQN